MFSALFFQDRNYYYYFLLDIRAAAVFDVMYASWEKSFIHNGISIGTMTLLQNI